jgi:hypothetical protein
VIPLAVPKRKKIISIHGCVLKALSRIYPRKRPTAIEDEGTHCHYFFGLGSPGFFVPEHLSSIIIRLAEGVKPFRSSFKPAKSLDDPRKHPYFRDIKRFLSAFRNGFASVKIFNAIPHRPSRRL